MGSDLPDYQPPCLQRMSWNINEASKVEAIVNCSCLAFEITLQVSLLGPLVSSETSVKHNSPMNWVIFKKKKNPDVKIFWLKTCGPLPSYSRGGGGVSHRRGSYEMLSVQELDHNCPECFTSPPFIDSSLT